MTHLVFGTGLVGSFIGGSLLNAGIDTLFLGREKQRKAMLTGLTLSELDGNSASIQPPVFLTSDTTNTAGISDTMHFDVIWFTVKCTSIQSSLDQLEQLVSPSTIIICCQNGFGSDRYVREALPTHTILNAIVGFNVAENTSNHLHRSTDGHLVIEDHHSVKRIVPQLNSDLMPAHIATDINAERWAKLQLNLANPVNALADIPTKAMMEDHNFRKVIANLMRELLNVTKAMQLSLPKLTALPATLLPAVLNLPNFIYLPLSQKTLAIDPSARASMWWDLSQKKKSEIQYLNQSVVEQGKLLGIDCQFNKGIVNLVHEVEQGQREIGLSGLELRRLLNIT